MDLVEQTLLYTYVLSPIGQRYEALFELFSWPRFDSQFNFNLYYSRHSVIQLNFNGVARPEESGVGAN